MSYLTLNCLLTLGRALVLVLLLIIEQSDQDAVCAHGSNVAVLLGATGSHGADEAESETQVGGYGGGRGGSGGVGSGVSD